MKKTILALILALSISTSCYAAYWVETFDANDLRASYNADSIKHYEGQNGTITEGAYSLYTASSRFETTYYVKIQDKNLLNYIVAYCSYRDGVKEKCVTPVFKEQWPKPGSVMESLLQNMVNYGKGKDGAI